jgi:hypothetical protein
MERPLSFIYAWIAKVSLKVWGVLLAVGVFLAWLAKFRYDAIKLGEQRIKDKVRAKTEKVHEEWSEIDRSDPSLDDALDELQRDRRN